MSECARASGRVRVGGDGYEAQSSPLLLGMLSTFVIHSIGQSPACQQMQTFVPRLIEALPKINSILLRLGRAAVVFEYLRVGHYLVQKGGIREDRVVYFCELLLVAQLFNESLVLAREGEKIFATAIVASYLAHVLSTATWWVRAHGHTV